VVLEIQRLAENKKAACKAARVAAKSVAKDAAAASSPSSSSSSSTSSSSPPSSAAGTMPDMGADSDDEEDDADEGDNDGDFPDKDPLVLSDSDVEAILDGIADFRGSPVDWDYGEDGSDSFAAFIDELEREDRAEDLKSFGF
jgi:hypothetical protein